MCESIPFPLFDTFVLTALFLNAEKNGYANLMEMAESADNCACSTFNSISVRPPFKCLLMLNAYNVQ